MIKCSNFSTIKLQIYFDKIFINKITQIRTLTRLRDTLLPKLMIGDVRVKDVEKSVEAAS